MGRIAYERSEHHNFSDDVDRVLAGNFTGTPGSGPDQIAP
jgi:hypothetical protein